MSPTKVTHIKRQLETGLYRVDPYAVADAMIRRAELELELAGQRAPRMRAQRACSNPTNPLVASVKRAPAGPSTTVPTKLRAAVIVGQAA
jgi:Anti-sigma-28 factor, FlgM